MPTKSPNVIKQTRAAFREGQIPTIMGETKKSENAPDIDPDDVAAYQEELRRPLAT